MPRYYPKYQLRPFGLSGYTLVYPACDAATLREIRAFQEQVAATYPDWTSRLDYGLDECRLHVFPLGELAQVALATAHSRYRRRY